MLRDDDEIFPAWNSSFSNFQTQCGDSVSKLPGRKHSYDDDDTHTYEIEPRRLDHDLKIKREEK